MAFPALFVSDCHDNPKAIAALEVFLQKHSPKLVVFAGDLTTDSGEQGVSFAKKMFSACGAAGARILAQRGNMDDEFILKLIEEKGISIHAKRVVVAGRTIVGLEGCSTSPFNTPVEYSEEEYEKLLEGLVDGNTIFVPHCPPNDTVADRISSGLHVGSKAVRKTVDECQPLFCLCGHIHEAKGEQLLGKTRLLKLEPLQDGKAALVDLESLQWAFLSAGI